MKQDLVPNNLGLELVRRVVNARERKRHADSEANSASCEVSNAETELVKWLVPKGAKAGETFCLPVGRTFLEVRMVERERFGVSEGDVRSSKHTEVVPVVEWRGGIALRPEELR